MGSAKHTPKLRGRPKFWERTSNSIETLKRMRKEHNLDYTIRLKNVIMAGNLHDTINVADYANQDGMEVFFQRSNRTTTRPDDPNGSCIPIPGRRTRPKRSPM